MLEQDLEGLRRQVQELQRREIASRENEERLSRLIHELEVHQEELRTKNEHLEHVQAELETSRQRYLDLFDYAPVGYLLLDRHGVIHELNIRGAELLGRARGGLMGKPLWLYVDATCRDQLSAHLRDVFRLKHARQELQVKRGAEGTFYAAIETILVTGVTAAPQYCRMAMLDISELKLAERELRDREEQLRLILASTSEGIFGTDTEGRYTFANRACVKQLGYHNEAELLGQKTHELIHHTGADGEPYPLQRCPTFQAYTENRVTFSDGELLWRADGTSFPVEYYSHPIMRDGELIGAVVTFSDITERKHVQEALRRERDFAESLVDTAQAIVLVVDPEGRIIRFNRFMEQLCGYRLEELKGKDCALLFPDGSAPRVRAVLGKAVTRLDTRMTIEPIRTRSGTQRIIEWRDTALTDAAGHTLGLLCIGHDVTERLEKEAQLLQAQKMEVMGRLTGGIAHDFNNLLTIILGNLRLLRTLIEPDQEILELLQDGLSAAEDGAELVRRLLAYSRKKDLRPQHLNINQFLSEFQRFLRRTLGEAVELRLTCAKEVRHMLVDRTQLESALLNLALNARDAMPKGGVLSIETATAHIDGHESTPYGDLKAGHYIKVSLSDTGAGMSAEDTVRAIEPFYTTKPDKKGSGLGLSMVYSFAKESGGTLLLTSEPGKGTTAALVLPASAGREAREPAEVVISAPVGGSETVLIVEDEPRIRKFATRSLSRLGYRVLEAADAQQAIAILKAEPEIDLLFSDIVMPGGMDGRELAQWVIQRCWLVEGVLFSCSRGEGRLRHLGEAH